MFSNGTEFEGWQEAWCQTCKKDLDESCDIILRGLMREPTPEWGRGPHWSPQTVVYCTEYELIPPVPPGAECRADRHGDCRDNDAVRCLCHCHKPPHTITCAVYEQPMTMPYAERESACTCGRPA